MSSSGGIRQGLRHGRSLIFLAAFIVTGCGSVGQDAGVPVQQTGLEAPSESQPLVVATRNSATSYMIDRNEKSIGPEFDRVTAFVEAQGWNVQWEVHSTTAGVLEALVHGKAHRAAAGLSRTPQRDERFTASRAYRKVEEQLVCQRGSARAGALRAAHPQLPRRHRHGPVTPPSSTAATLRAFVRKWGSE